MEMDKNTYITVIYINLSAAILPSLLYFFFSSSFQFSSSSVKQSTHAAPQHLHHHRNTITTISHYNHLASPPSRPSPATTIFGSQPESTSPPSYTRLHHHSWFRLSTAATDHHRHSGPLLGNSHISLSLLVVVFFLNNYIM